MTVCLDSRLARAVAVAVGALLLLVGLSVPAAAHEGDPRVVTTLDEVLPALPDGVVVQVQASLAAQLVADNPSDTPLEVLGRDGEPFLRLSAAGVEADVTSDDFLSTSSPTGAVPPEAGADRPARWVQISAGTSWGWFDHRLHPGQAVLPDDQQRPALLDTWAVPMRYGDAPLQVRGSVEFVPLLGAFVVSADPAPESLTVQALPGRLPGLFLSNPERRPMTVLGRDGEPFLRFGPAGLEVNTASRTHVEDQQSRGRPAGPPSPEPAFEVVDPAGTSYTWLDTRLRYDDDLPPDDALRATEPVVVDRWEVPVQGLAGTPALTGEVRWVPEAAAAEARRAAAEQPLSESALPLGLGLLAVLVLGGAVVAVRRRRAA